MPDQNTHAATKVGDTLDADTIITLPVGAVVTDRDGDSYRQNENGTWSRQFDTPDEYVVTENSHVAGIRGYFDNLFTPYTLRRLPHGPSSAAQPDLHQQARIALRDRYGVEPDEDDIQRVSQAIDEGNLTPSAAVSALCLAKAYEGQKAQPTATRYLAGPFINDFGVVVFVKNEDTAGLARLRAHAALDQLLDQHGITR